MWARGMWCLQTTFHVLGCMGAWGLFPQALLQGTGSWAGAGSVSLGYQPAQQRPAWELLAYPQQANRSCVFMVITRSMLAYLPPPLHFPLLSKAISHNFYKWNKTKALPHLCSLLPSLPHPHCVFLSHTGSCSLYNSKERQGHAVCAFYWWNRRLSRGRSGLGISFQIHCGILPPTWWRY